MLVDFEGSRKLRLRQEHRVSGPERLGGGVGNWLGGFGGLEGLLLGQGPYTPNSRPEGLVHCWGEDCAAAVIHSEITPSFGGVDLVIWMVQGCMVG